MQCSRNIHSNPQQIYDVDHSVNVLAARVQSFRVNMPNITVEYEKILFPKIKKIFNMGVLRKFKEYFQKENIVCDDYSYLVILEDYHSYLANIEYKKIKKIKDLQITLGFFFSLIFFVSQFFSAGESIQYWTKALWAHNIFLMGCLYIIQKILNFFIDIFIPEGFNNMQIDKMKNQTKEPLFYILSILALEIMFVTFNIIKSIDSTGYTDILIQTANLEKYHAYINYFNTFILLCLSFSIFLRKCCEKDQVSYSFMDNFLFLDQNSVDAFFSYFDAKNLPINPNGLKYLNELTFKEMSSFFPVLQKQEKEKKELLIQVRHILEQESDITKHKKIKDFLEQAERAAEYPKCPFYSVPSGKQFHKNYLKIKEARNIIKKYNGNISELVN